MAISHRFILTKDKDARFRRTTISGEEPRHQSSEVVLEELAGVAVLEGAEKENGQMTKTLVALDNLYTSCFS